MFARRARGLLDFTFALLCVWCAYHHTPAVVATAMARATRIRRRDVMDPRIDRYWTVAVPVIVGWTVQR